MEVAAALFCQVTQVHGYARQRCSIKNAVKYLKLVVTS
jgi:hypothetical protein